MIPTTYAAAYRACRVFSMSNCPHCGVALFEEALAQSFCQSCGKFVVAPNPPPAASIEDAPHVGQVARDTPEYKQSVARMRATLSEIVRRSMDFNEPDDSHPELPPPALLFGKPPVAPEALPGGDYGTNDAQPGAASDGGNIATGTGSGSDSFATVQYETPAKSAEPETVNDRTIARTQQFDSNHPLNLPPADIGPPAPRVAPPTGSANPEALARIWEGGIGGQANPQATIKGGGSPTATVNSRLFIGSRAVRLPGMPHERETDYELMEVIGEGGMGVVYAARQGSIDRVVAIKMLKPELAADKDQCAKFLSEAVITGDLEHPNIVPIYDLGSNQSGAYFYSMKRVEGTPWVKVLPEKPLTENLEILLKVADAIAFAHARGLVHRDIKPENVMLGEFGEVLVMDWGLALSTKAFRRAGSITQSMSMGGTPAYMAPEMAVGPLETVGPASDVYLLGAALYEVITGQPPHSGRNVMQCLYAAARNEIQPTSHSGELVDIAMRCMATLPADRYASVRDFQAAVRNYQAHSESIALSSRAEQDLAEAEQTGNYQSFSKALFAFEESLALWNENPRSRSGISQVQLAYAQSAESKGDYDLGLSLLSSEEPSHVALRERLLAAQAEREARQRRFSNLRGIAAALAASIVIVIVVALVQISADRDRARTAEVEANEERDNARVAAAQAKRATELEEIAAATARQSAETARKAAVAAQEAEMQAKTDRDIARMAKDAEEYEGYVARIGLAAAKIDENAFDYARQLLDECKPALRHWEWGRLMHLCTQAVHNYKFDSPIDSVAYSADGKRFAIGCWGGKAIICDVDSGEHLTTIAYGGNYVNAVKFSPDGKYLAVGGSNRDGYARIYRADNGQLVQSLKGHTDAVLSVAFSKAGNRLLTTSYDNTARLWEVPSGQLVRSFLGHSWWVWSAAFSPDESQVVTGSQDGTARVWNVRDQRSEAIPVFNGHIGPVYAVAYSPDGTHVASAGYDKRILIWKPTDLKPFDFSKIGSGQQVEPPKFREFDAHAAPVRSLAYSVDGSRLLSAGHDNVMRLWDATLGKAVRTFRGHGAWIRASGFSPDGEAVISAGHDFTAKIWSIDGYEESRVLRGHVLRGHDDAVLSATFSGDDEQIITASRDRTARSWDSTTGQPVATFDEGHQYLASTVMFADGGKRLLTAAVDNTARMWDVSSGGELFRLDNTGRAAVAAVSRDGSTLVVGGDDLIPKIHDASTGALLRPLEPFRSEVAAVAISGDNKYVVAADAIGRCRVADVATGKTLHEARFHNGRINAAAFLPDHRTVLTASVDHSVGYWDIIDNKEDRSRILRHPAAVTALSVSADGKIAVTNCSDHVVRVWDLQTSRELTVLSAAGEVNALTIAPDGSKVVTVTYQNGKADAGAPSSLIRSWSLPDGKLVQSYDLQGALVWSAAFSDDTALLATVGGNSARVWDSTSGKQLMTFGPHGAVASANFSPDRKRVVTGSWDNSAKIWNVERQSVESKLVGGHHGFINTAFFSPDGTKVLTASDDRTAILWDVATAKPLGSFAGHTDRVRWAKFSPDGAKVVTGSSDRTARVWDVTTRRQLISLKGHAAAVLCAEFGPGDTVLTGSEDKTAKLWNASTGELIRTLSGHTAAVSCVAYAPISNGQVEPRAITGSLDSTAKLWDWQTGKEVLNLRGHNQEITSVAFSHSGRMLLTASRDGTAIVWLTVDWADGHLAAVSKRSSASRSLSLPTVK